HRHLSTRPFTQRWWQRLPYFACRVPSWLMTFTAVFVIEMDIYVVADRIVSQCRLQCCRMVVTIYRRLTKLFPPIGQHHLLTIAFTIVRILRQRTTLTPAVD